MTIPTPVMLESSPSVYGKSVDAEYPDQMTQGICKRLDVEVMSLKDFLSRDDYKPYDEHWSERGHRNVARVIAKIYRDKAELRNQRRKETAMNGRAAFPPHGLSVY